MSPYAAALARRILPDDAQLQIALGTLFGAGRLVPTAGGVGLALTLDARHGWLADWTYERLAPLVPAPLRRGRCVEICGAAHPFFGDLSVILASPSRVRALVGPCALWTWATHLRVRECERRAVDACACAAACPPDISARAS